MALPALIPAAVSAVGSFFGSLFGANKQDKINQEQMQFSREMYERQRQDNLFDYNMQNEYNSPVNVMKRLREAGLNPNMVYGHGQAVAQAAPLKGADSPKWNPTARAVDPGAALNTGLNMYMDISQREAQTDNLKAQNTILLQDSLLKKAQTDKTNIEVLRDQLDLNRGTELYQYSLDMYKQQLRKLSLDADKAFYDTGLSDLENRFRQDTYNERVDAARMSPEATRARIDNVISSTKNNELQAEFKALEVDLRKNGINPSDPIYFRVVGQLLSKYGITIK